MFKRFCHILPLTSLILCGSLLLVAQAPLVSIQKFGKEDGLSHREVFCSIQDSKGFMWFGTKYGLNRFDGYNFQWFTKEKDSLGFNEIHYILEDSEGWFWLILTESVTDKRTKNIALFHPITHQTLSLEEKFGNDIPFKSNEVFDFCSSPSKSLFFSTKDNYLVSYVGGSRFTKNKIDIPHPIGHLICDSDKIIWGMPFNDWNPTILVGLNRNGEILVNKTIAGRKIGISLVEVRNDNLYYIVKRNESASTSFHTLDASGTIWNNLSVFEDMPLGFKGALDDQIQTGYQSSFSNTEAQTVFLRLPESLFYYDLHQKWLVDLSSRNPEFRTTNQVYFAKDNHIWISTKFGLFLVDIRNSFFNKILDRDPSESDFSVDHFECREMIEDQSGEILINTYRGTWSLKSERDKLHLPEPHKILTHVNSKSVEYWRYVHNEKFVNFQTKNSHPILTLNSKF